MCGRIAQSEPRRYAQRLEALFRSDPAWRPSWNVAPTDPLLGVRLSRQGRVMLAHEWGLLPGWSKDSAAARPINARAETVATKPAYRSAFLRRRLLVPVDGFYEWKTVPGAARKQPYFFRRADGEPVVLAGLWERWRRGDDECRSAAVLTSPAGPDMPIHDRQPVVLEPDAWERWLDPELDDVAEVEGMLRPRSGVLVHHAVSRDVGSVRNNGPYLIEPVVEPVPDDGSVTAADVVPAAHPAPVPRLW